jgi:hypothetical protein
MYCSHCGMSIDPSSQYCPKCGLKAPNEDLKPHEKQMQGRRRGGFWLKALWAVLAIVVLGVAWLFYFTEDLTESIRGQLQALKEHRVTEAYYAYTSKAFQKTTSLDTFREILKDYPIFSEPKSINLTDTSIKEGHLVAKGTLTSLHDEMGYIEYQLVKEGEAWKINSIDLTLPDQKSTSDNPHSMISQVENSKGSYIAKSDDKTSFKELSQPVEKFLNALQKNDLENSWGSTDVAFQHASSKEAFQEFLRNYPILTGYKHYVIKDATVLEDLGTVHAILDPEKEALQIEFKLVKENNEWKIWSIKVEFPQEILSPTSVHRVANPPQSDANPPQNNGASPAVKPPPPPLAPPPSTMTH